ncbi:nucleotidyltransferase domain-containing protein [Paenibacillus spongiae]|uniref:Nucleotidyltransferase domain-containing protein n=1 Tax=Paenibacillus spongiae TaxID=2909671 RepID=A0ABY5SH46_9BACL|nr:nucleotidyltransferase domain-containing protein [Paenibacillus spongiae]UVI32918.1 nucleotidyltransferase domain-containing protein [Paenibacillus spongiae]
MVMERVIDGMVQSVVKHCNPEQIVLFGSCAKGTFRQDSDIDLLILLDTDVPRPYRAIELKQLFLEYPVAVDLVILTPEEYEEERRKPYSFAYSVSLSGRVLYEKQNADSAAR